MDSGRIILSAPNLPVMRQMDVLDTGKRRDAGPEFWEIPLHHLKEERKGKGHHAGPRRSDPL